MGKGTEEKKRGEGREGGVREKGGGKGRRSEREGGWEGEEE